MNNKRQIISMFLILVMVLLLACAPQAVPAPQTLAPAAAPAPAAVPIAPVKAAWEVEWDKTLAAARSEGRLSLATSTGSDIRTALVQAFKAAYGISVEAISGKGAQLSPKIFAERRAGLYLQDVYIGGSETPILQLKPAGALDPIAPELILPDLTQPELVKKTWYQGELYWLDKERTYVLSTALNVTFPIAINTKLIKEGEIKSWRDLLNPKWQGKLLLNDPLLGGAGANLLVFAEDRLGWDYFVELVKTKPLVLTDQRLMLDWLAHGKVAIVVAPSPDDLPEFIKLGAPVRGLIPEEGTWMSGGSSNLAVFNKRPHRNASKVFVNWLLSKEGSTVFSRAADFHMTRLDVPTDHLAPDRVRDPKMQAKYLVTLAEETALKKDSLKQKAKPLLAPLMGK